MNVLISPADKVLTVAELQYAGVERVSLGPALYTNTLTALEQAARALKTGDIASATTGIGFDRVGELLTRAS